MADNHPPVHSHIGMLTGNADAYSTHGHKLDLDRDLSKYAVPYNIQEMKTLILHGEMPIIIIKPILLRKLSKKSRKAYVEQRQRLNQYIQEDAIKQEQDGEQK